MIDMNPQFKADTKGAGSWMREPHLLWHGQGLMIFFCACCLRLLWRVAVLCHPN
jgi:hypothetical protein